MKNYLKIVWLTFSLSSLIIFILTFITKPSFIETAFAKILGALLSVNLVICNISTGKGKDEEFFRQYLKKLLCFLICYAAVFLVLHCFSSVTTSIAILLGSVPVVSVLYIVAKKRLERHPFSRIRRQIPLRRIIFLGVFSVALSVIGYLLLAHRQHERNPDDRTIPVVSQLKDGIKTAFGVNKRTEERWVVVDAIATAKRLFLGLGIGIFSSIVLGLLMGSFRTIESFFLPPLTFFAKIPPTAALAVFFVMVGTGTEMFVTMIVFGVLPTLSQAIYLAVKDIPDESIDKAATLGGSICEQIWNVVFRQVLPKILDSIRLQIGPAMIFLIAAELLCADVGFGYRIRLQSRLLNMSVVYPYLIILGAFGFFMDTFLKFLVKKLCPWYVAGRS